MELPKLKKGTSQYKTVALFLYKWSKYCIAPNKREQGWSKAIASSISIRISHYCWPEARELYKQWKEVLKLQEQSKGLSSDELILLHIKTQNITLNLISSFINLHNSLSTSAPTSGEWSKPMSKRKMMSALGMTSYKKFNAFAKKHGIEQAGNRKLWQIRLDNMDKNTRFKLEKLP